MAYSYVIENKLFTFPFLVRVGINASCTLNLSFTRRTGSSTPGTTVPGTRTLTDNAPGLSQAIGLTVQAIEPSAATPTFSLPSGTYPNSALTITDVTSGAVIYYTMNGTMPTTSSAAYTKPNRAQLRWNFYR